MSKVLNGLSWLVTVQPVATILVLLAVTIILGAGFTRLAPQGPDTVFLPTDSAVATANDEIEMVFGDPAPTVTATLLFRGQPLTPEGLSQIAAVASEVESRSEELLLAAPVVSPTLPLAAALGTSDFAATSQADIDAAEGNPALARLVGFDDDGTQVAAVYVRLHKVDDEQRLETAELALRDIARASTGPAGG